MKAKTLSALICTILLSSSIIASSCANANSKEDGVSAIIKTIELNATAGEDVDVFVSNGDDKQVIQLDWADKDNEQLILEKIGHLDLDIQENVLEVLNSLDLNANFHGLDDANHAINKTVIVLNDKELGSVKQLMNSRAKVFALKGGETADFEGIFEIENKFKGLSDDIKVIKFQTDKLKVHTDIIVNLLETGEFDRDQLDRIQASLDALR